MEPINIEGSPKTPSIKFEIEKGILEEECTSLLTSFFKELRELKKQKIRMEVQNESRI